MIKVDEKWIGCKEGMRRLKIVRQKIEKLGIPRQIEKVKIGGLEEFCCGSGLENFDEYRILREEEEELVKKLRFYRAVGKIFGGIRNSFRGIGKYLDAVNFTNYGPAKVLPDNPQSDRVQSLRKANEYVVGEPY